LNSGYVYWDRRRILRVVWQEVDPIIIFLQEFPGIFTFEGESWIKKIYYFTEDLMEKRNWRISLELYDPLIQYILVHTTCNNFLTIKNLWNTTNMTNTGCPNYVLVFCAVGGEE
jgi:hypothetical protein